eukprot:m.169994 g.169994  ORF g.169994 m.169994 type:complete len:572 (+) comp15333_c0_seq2:191-1906(+)
MDNQSPSRGKRGLSQSPKKSLKNKPLGTLLLDLDDEKDGNEIGPLLDLDTGETSFSSITDGSERDSTEPLALLPIEDHGSSLCSGCLSEDGKKIMAAALGNIMEWYDFGIFGALADIIGEVFFPAGTSSSLRLIDSFAVFGAAFFMRPIGGLLFGRIGDKYGRKPALIYSMLLMTVATVATGCMPSYKMVGIAAPLLLLGARLAQGLSTGGELVGSIVLLVECAPPNKAGLYGSLSLWFAVIGLLIGNLVGTIMRYSINHDEMLEWGWRVPFLLGLPLGVVGYIASRSMSESEDFEEAKENNELSKHPIYDSFTKHWRATIRVAFVASLWAGGFYISSTWAQHFMASLSEPKVPHPFAVNLSAGGIIILAFPMSGYLADVRQINLFGIKRDWNCKNTMFLGAVGILFVAFPLFLLLRQGSDGLAFFGLAIYNIFIAMWGAPMCTWMVDSFPPMLRVTAVAIGYNIAQALVGGTVDLAATAIAKSDGYAPIGLVVFLAVVGIAGLSTSPNNVGSSTAETGKAYVEVAGFFVDNMGIGNDPYQDNGGSEEEEEFEEHQELAENPNEERSFYDL